MTCADRSCWAQPLLRTRLVRDRAGDEEPGAATLEALVGAAVETLREHPRDDKLWRAVERTYVRPAATQERAPRRWGCRSAPTAAISPRAWTGSWPGCGTRRSTAASATEHNRAASGLETEQRRAQPPGDRGGRDEHADRRPGGGARRQHGGLLAAQVLADATGR